MRMRSVTTTGLLLAGLCASYSTQAWASAEEAKFYLESARRMMQSHDLRGARIQLFNAEKSDPADPKIRIELAKFHLVEGDSIAAQAELIAARQRGASDEMITPVLVVALYRSGQVGELLREIKPGNRPPSVESAVRAYRGMASLAIGDLATANTMISDAERLDPNAVVPRVAHARLFLVSHRLSDAQRKITEALKLAPKNPEVLDVSGIALFMQGKNGAALKQFGAAIAAVPQNAQALLDRANVEIAVNDLTSAQRDIDAARKIAPDSVLGLYLQAMVHIRQGKFADADVELTRMRASMDQIVEAYFLAGLVKYNLNQLEQATTFLTHYIAHREEPAKAFALLGAITLRRGEIDNAIRFLERGHQKDPRDAEIVGLLGQAYGEKGDEEKSAALLGEILTARTETAAAQPSTTASGETGIGVVELGHIFGQGKGNVLAGPPLVLLAIQAARFDEAARIATTLVKLNPNNLYYQHLLGSALMAQRNFAAAEILYNELLAKHPDSNDARRSLARIYTETDRLPKAQNLYKDILAKNPKDENAVVALAALSANTGDYGAAIQQLRRAQVLDPKSALLSTFIMANYMQMKDWAGAVAEGRKALVRFPNERDIHDNLGKSQVASGDLTGAAETYHSAVARFPRDSELWANYSSVLEMQKDNAAALKAMQQASEIDPKNTQYKTSIVLLTYAIGGPSAALKTAHALSMKKPPDPDGILLEAEVLARSNRLGDAINLLKKTMAGKATRDTAIKLVDLYRARNDDKSAVGVLSGWTKAHPDDFDARMILAQIEGESRNYDAALTEFQWLEKRRPSDPTILNNLAWLYSRKNDPRAKIVAQKAYQLSPHSADVADTYGWILISGGDAANGVKILQSASVAAPSNPQIQYHWAVALSKTNRAMDARVALTRLLQDKKTFAEREDAQQLLAKLGGTLR